jgi:hypothetical protein
MLMRSIKSQARTPLLLMAAIEIAILFSSVYASALVVLGSFSDCTRLLGPVVPKAATVTAVAILSLMAMGLYQSHQRLYFSEAVVRVLVGLTLASLGLAILYYAFPAIYIAPDIASVYAGIAVTRPLHFRSHCRSPCISTSDIDLRRREASCQHR